MHITGEPDGPPTKVGYAVTDVLTGHSITQGIMAALLHLERTGQG
jgi:succinate--hydroxymethylglutarate CoA-transferase